MSLIHSHPKQYYIMRTRLNFEMLVKYENRVLDDCYKK